MEKIRWGIIATGNIASKFAEACRYESARSGRSMLSGVASRDPGRARQFASRWGIPLTFGSYDELFQSPDIDAVYIATPHNQHASLSIAALRAGKAVLCEKPVSVTCAEFRPVVETARSEQRFFMEAMWMKFNPSFRRALQWVAEGRVGTLRFIRSDFFLDKPYDPESRLYNPALGGGALLDVGIYPVTCALMFAGKQKPSAMDCQVEWNDQGVDVYEKEAMSWPSGLKADLSSAINLKGVEPLRSAAILGDRGSIVLPFFWMAQEARLYGEHDTEIEHFRSPFECNGYEYEIREVEDCLFRGVVESPVQTWADSIMVMELLDDIRKK